MSNNSEIAQLLEKWRRYGLTSAEKARFKEVYKMELHQEMVLEMLEIHLEADEFINSVQVFGKEESMEYLEGRTASENVPPVHRVHLLRTAWFRVAVAILIIVGVGTYLWNQNISGIDDLATKPVPVQNDMLPGGNKATLTLADGSVIILDSAGNGKLTLQAGAVIQKSGNGEIIYSFDKTSLNNNVEYNTMITPRGGTYQLILPDGSKVWLNAESSITFPTVFTGNKREVKMTGEVYFEVKPSKAKPFIVNTGKEQIEILGTSFNVKSYSDELFKTSLVEGAVKINNIILKPSQAYANGKVVSTNTRQDIAWKNGEFDFTNLTLQQAAYQIGRWYDVDIQFDGPLPNAEIYGGVNRSVTLQRLLKAMEGEFAHFTLEGKVLHIKAL